MARLDTMLIVPCEVTMRFRCAACDATYEYTVDALPGQQFQPAPPYYWTLVKPDGEDAVLYCDKHEVAVSVVEKVG